MPKNCTFFHLRKSVQDCSFWPILAFRWTLLIWLQWTKSKNDKDDIESNFDQLSFLSLWRHEILGALNIVDGDLQFEATFFWWNAIFDLVCNLCCCHQENTSQSTMLKMSCLRCSIASKLLCALFFVHFKECEMCNMQWTHEKNCWGPPA